MSSPHCMMNFRNAPSTLKPLDMYTSLHCVRYVIILIDVHTVKSACVPILALLAMYRCQIKNNQLLLLMDMIHMVNDVRPRTVIIGRTIMLTQKLLLFNGVIYR